MKRQKIELIETVKVQDVKEAPMKNLEIVKVFNVETMHGTKPVMIFLNGKDQKQVFLNAISINNLITAYGSEDEHWKGKKVNLGIKNDKTTMNMDAIIVQPLIS